MSSRVFKEAVLAMDACNPMRKSVHGSTATARWKVSRRPCCGMLARMPAGWLTAASCYWISFSARLTSVAFSSALLLSRMSLASCWV